MAEYRLTEAGRIGLRMLLEAEALHRADRRGLHLLGMEDVVDLPDEWTEPVPPPLPPEPEPGLWEVGTITAYRSAKPISETHQWQILSETYDELVTGFVGWYEWSTVVARAGADPQVRRLVPAPEPVTLPWRSGQLAGGEYTHVWVGFGTEVRERIDTMVGGIRVEAIAPLPPEVARAKAYALLSAADEAERSHG